MTKSGKCCLCMNVGPLVKSHILPRAAYKRILDKDGAAKRYRERHPPQKGGSGYYSWFLCASCEKMSQSADDHAMTLAGDPQLIRRFVLWSIWRSAAAKSITPYLKTTRSLGKYEEQARALLSDAESPIPTTFMSAVIMRRTDMRNGTTYNQLSLPMRLRTDGSKDREWIFKIMSFMIRARIGSRRWPQHLERCSIGTFNNTIHIIERTFRHDETIYAGELIAKSEQLHGNPWLPSL